MNALQNLRDLGGLPVAGGRAVRSGVLFRSEAPLPGDLAPELSGWPPSLVLDLRGPSEGHPLATSTTAIEQIHLSAGASVAGLIKHGTTLEDLYRTILRDAGPLFVHGARLIAQAEGSVLVHCAAGKDRTGMFIAILLAAVGVERDALVRDYLATRARMPEVIARMRLARGHDGGAAIDRLVAERPDLADVTEPGIEHVLDTVGADAAAWLVDRGLPADVPARLAQKLVV